jgi:hypothetical protein
VSELIVPPLEGDGDWPSLGSGVCDWMEDRLAFGPGDLLGQPYRLDDEDRALLERMYQVYPKGHDREGRRRFDTVVIMTRKGTKKSERLAAVCSAELSPDAPVRFDGWRRRGRSWEPVGRPVVSPFVFLLAFGKEQAEDTSWDAMRAMILGGSAADYLDVWEEKIVRKDGTGEAKALATAPDSRDGGKTTFQGKEESHRWVMPRHHEAHQTTRGNLSKRPIAEPWEMHATTAYAPGEGSVAETMHDVAKGLKADRAKQSRMFFFYRWADSRIRIYNEDGSLNQRNLREAVVDASGPVAAKWSDIDGIMELQFLGAGADPEYGERVWLNRTIQRTEIAFDVEAFKKAATPSYRIARREGSRKGALVALGFDGSRGSVDPRRIPDHTGLIATEISTGFQTVLGHWDPADYPDRMIPREAVDIAIDDAFHDFDVWRLYADPNDWDPELANWRGKYGVDRVIEWWTYRERAMGNAVANYVQAVSLGLVPNDGHPEFTAHIGHAHKRLVNARDDKGDRLFLLTKERPSSPLKIDLADAGTLSWEARSDAIAAGALEVRPSKYLERGLVSV